MSLFRRRRDDVAEPTKAAAVAPVSRGEVAQRLQAASPASGHKLADGLLPALRYAVRREPDAAIDVGRSKFGGAPDLPRGTSWPSWTPPGEDKRPLQFFAQLDLAEAAAEAPSDLGLPPDGLLSFFADFDPERATLPAPEAVEVFYSPADAQLSRCGLRLVPLTTAQLHPLGTWSWPMSSENGVLQTLVHEFDSELQGRAPLHYQVTTRHQLGGYVPGVDGFVLLQFDSDATLDLAWRPGQRGGRLVWTLPPASLAAREWSAARFSLLA